MTKDLIMQMVDAYAGYNYGSAVSKEARAAVVAAIEQLTKDARLGAYVAQAAVNHGWSTNEPEDAYSFMLRRCREVAIDDCSKDAARYQWLRTCNNDSHVIYGDTHNCELMMEEVLDNAIDKAMKEQV